MLTRALESLQNLGTFAQVRYSGFDLSIRYSQYVKISRTYKSIIALKQIQKGKFYPNQSYLAQIKP